MRRLRLCLGHGASAEEGILLGGDISGGVDGLVLDRWFVATPAEVGFEPFASTQRHHRID